MFSKSNRKTAPTHTRKINPLLGLLGILGLLGFLGFLPMIIILPDSYQFGFGFFFFGFFGFFGFYYEGKMSNTLIDERFKLNAFRAEAIANKTALVFILAVTIFFVSIVHISDVQTMLNILIATLGLALGLATFLQQYLLYRFDRNEE